MKWEAGAISMLDVLRRIAFMNDAEQSQTGSSVMGRYSTLYPKKEIIFLSLPKDDPAERRRILKDACRLSER